MIPVYPGMLMVVVMEVVEITEWPEPEHLLPSSPVLGVILGSVVVK